MRSLDELFDAVRQEIATLPPVAAEAGLLAAAVELLGSSRANAADWPGTEPAVAADWRRQMAAMEKNIRFMASMRHEADAQAAGGQVLRQESIMAELERREADLQLRLEEMAGQRAALERRLAEGAMESERLRKDLELFRDLEGFAALLHARADLAESLADLRSRLDMAKVRAAFLPGLADAPFKLAEAERTLEALEQLMAERIREVAGGLQAIQAKTGGVS
jgi:predicted  nucleic acid-binding Zn-ribbon protein